MQMKRWTLAGLMALMAFSAAAMPPTGAGWQRSYAQPPAPVTQAGELVREGVENLLGFMGQTPRPTALRMAVFLEEYVAPHFDFALMTRMSLGAAGNRLSDIEKKDIQQKLEQDFLETLSSRLASFDAPKVRFYRPRQGRGQRVSVSVGIANPGQYPSRLEFRLFLGKSGWKVYDVLANGNSAVNYYRQKFARNWAPPSGFPARR
jgi:phospholipid transport system substrate-binding protein